MAAQNAAFPMLVGMSLAGLSPKEFWIQYSAMGGSRDVVSLRAFLAGQEDWPAQEHTVAACAINGTLEDAGSSFRVPLPPGAALGGR